jgi:hypothetical protein
MDERLGEEKASCAVTLTVDVEKRPDEILASGRYSAYVWPVKVPPGPMAEQV